MLSSWLEQTRRTVSAFEDFVFPPICAGCRERGRWLCAACRADLKVLANPLCARCGQLVDEPSEYCSNCRSWPNEMGAVRAAFEFDGPLRTAIHRYKYQSEFARAPSLCDLLVAAIDRGEFSEATHWDFITYVPLHVRRRRKRGFDQARLLALGLANRIKTPLRLDLTRVIDTPSQVGLGARERQVNVRNAFKWTSEPLVGAQVLIVDDVITTGSTLVAASLPLIQAGATRVDGLAVARERYHGA